MKVVFLARYLPAEGSTTHIYTLANELLRRGNEVHLISSGPNNDEFAISLFNSEINRGLIHHQVNFPHHHQEGLDDASEYKIFGLVKQLMQYVTVTPQVLRKLYKIRPDVLHVHYPVTSYLASVYRLLKGKKFITTYHASGIPDQPLHRKADYAIAISKELQSELADNLGYEEDKIKLIFNGVPKEKFDYVVTSEDKLSARDNLGLPADKVIIGFIGRLTEAKGIDILIEAVSLIPQDNFHVCLVGTGNLNWAKQLIDKHNLHDSVSIFPPQEVTEFYKAFDIFVLPSRHEGFGLVTVEAMMMGIPIIRSGIQGASVQIDDGKNGFIFKNEDANELAEQLSLLINNPETRKSMGEKSREKALNDFTDEIMVDNLIEVYNLTMD